MHATNVTKKDVKNLRDLFTWKLLISRAKLTRHKARENLKLQIWAGVFCYPSVACKKKNWTFDGIIAALSYSFAVVQIKSPLKSRTLKPMHCEAYLIIQGPANISSATFSLGVLIFIFLYKNYSGFSHWIYSIFYSATEVLHWFAEMTAMCGNFLALSAGLWRHPVVTVPASSCLQKLECLETGSPWY